MCGAYKAGLWEYATTENARRALRQAATNEVFLFCAQKSSRLSRQCCARAVDGDGNWERVVEGSRGMGYAWEWQTLGEMSHFCILIYTFDIIYCEFMYVFVCGSMCHCVFCGGVTKSNKEQHEKKTQTQSEHSDETKERWCSSFSSSFAIPLP